MGPLKRIARDEQESHLPGQHYARKTIIIFGVIDRRREHLRGLRLVIKRQSNQNPVHACQ